MTAETPLVKISIDTTRVDTAANQSQSNRQTPPPYPEQDTIQSSGQNQSSTPTRKPLSEKTIRNRLWFVIWPLVCIIVLGILYFNHIHSDLEETLAGCKTAVNDKRLTNCSKIITEIRRIKLNHKKHDGFVAELDECLEAEQGDCPNASGWWTWLKRVIIPWLELAFGILTIAGCLVCLEVFCSCVGVCCETCCEFCCDCFSWAHDKHYAKHIFKKSRWVQLLCMLVCVLVSVIAFGLYNGITKSNELQANVADCNQMLNHGNVCYELEQQLEKLKIQLDIKKETTQQVEEALEECQERLDEKCGWNFWDWVIIVGNYWWVIIGGCVLLCLCAMGG